MINRWRGWVSRHSHGLGLLFGAYWLLMFLATHIELPQVESAPKNTDKAVHLVMYAGFAFLLSLWLSARRRCNRILVLLVFGAAVLYAGLDELLQGFTETRTAELWDFVMDVVGAVLGLSMFWLVRRTAPSFWEPAESQES
jgi:VanZ family protein